MLVKARWNVKDGAGWHDAGSVFDTESDLGDAVEVLNAPEGIQIGMEAVEEKPEPKPRSATRTRKTARK